MTPILIVDDLRDARELLGELALAAFPAAALLCADSVAAVRRMLGDAAPALALVDLSLGDGSGLEVIQHLRQQCPDCRVVVATIHDDDARIFAALQAGAEGYLLKDQPQDITLRQLTSITEGQPPLSPAIARRLIRHFQAPAASLPEDLLTVREREVLTLLARGLTLTDIGRQLEISRHTAGDHVKNIYRKLDISTRAQAALHAQRIGLT